MSSLVEELRQRGISIDAPPVIQRIGRVGDLNEYAFRYIGDDRPQVGLLAQDVERKHPEAVVTGPDGLKRVNYPLALALAERR